MFDVRCLRSENGSQRSEVGFITIYYEKWPGKFLKKVETTEVGNQMSDVSRLPQTTPKAFASRRRAKEGRLRRGDDPWATTASRELAAGLKRAFDKSTRSALTLACRSIWDSENSAKHRPSIRQLHPVDRRLR